MIVKNKFNIICPVCILWDLVLAKDMMVIGTLLDVNAFILQTPIQYCLPSLHYHAEERQQEMGCYACNDKACLG